MVKILDNLLKIIDNLSDIEYIYEKSKQVQSECDSRICDILHLIENDSDKLNSNVCVALVKELAEVREKRRVAKQNIDLYNEFKKHNLNNVTYDELKLLLQKRITFTYRNRYYSEDFSEIYKNL